MSARALGMYSLFGKPVTNRFSASSACRTGLRSFSWPGGRRKSSDGRSLKYASPTRKAMSAIASCARAAYCEYGKLFRTYSKKRVASIGFWSCFSCMPFSYALAALLASAPVTGLVMSTPASLPPAQAQRAARRSALPVVDLIVSFPRHPQRLRRGRGRMALRDERQEQALFLPLIRGLAAAQAAFQRPRRQLLVLRPFRRLDCRGAGVGFCDALRQQLPRDQARSISLIDSRPGAHAGRLGVVDVAQLAHARQRRFSLGFGESGAFQGAVQLERRPQAHGEQPQGLVEGGISRHRARIMQGKARVGPPCLRLRLESLDLEVVVRTRGGGFGSPGCRLRRA